MQACRTNRQSPLGSYHTIIAIPLVQADFAATAPLPKGNQLSTTLKSIEQQMTSKEFWDAP